MGKHVKQENPGIAKIEALVQEVLNDNRYNNCRMYWMAGLNTPDSQYLAMQDGRLAGLRDAQRALEEV